MGIIVQHIPSVLHSFRSSMQTPWILGLGKIRKACKCMLVRPLQ